MAIHFTADGGAIEIAPANGCAFTVPELNRLVGGFIEVVDAPNNADGATCYLVVHEDAKRNRYAVVNRVASALFHAAGGSSWEAIVGDVVLLTRAELGDADNEASDAWAR